MCVCARGFTSKRAHIGDVVVEDRRVVMKEDARILFSFFFNLVGGGRF